ncbi:MGMT family protein [Exiguobacterium flavidum]|uniref:MGMT family protein n=1 Tax=Exiguobacterium flavidum TaxID=2184695 RepID=UPI000DF78D52|nr:MGMT family protein [Exiguobacterium flavidum]
MYTQFTCDVIDLIKRIPPGKVMTYGQIAAYAGKPRGARQVSRILHSLSSKERLPWHRVVNARGELSLEGEEQRIALEAEGVVFIGKRIILTDHLYDIHP